MTDTTDPAYAAIRDLRQRLKDLEAYAAAQPPAAPLHDAIGDAMAQPKPTRAERDLRNAAHGWQPDDSMEQAIKAHDRDPAAYDAEMRRVGASNGLEMALYTRQRAAALALNPDALKETK